MPLYWLATTLFLGVLLLLNRAPSTARSADGGYVAREATSSSPRAAPDGLAEPVFGLGWTLEFEMLFYVLLTPLRPAPALARRRPVATLVLAALVEAGQARPSPAGHGAGHLGEPDRARVLRRPGDRAAGGPRPPPARVACGAGRCGDRGPGTRTARLAAAACLGAAGDRPGRRGDAGAAHAPRRVLERMLERWGDASYALYLVHPFVMRPATMLWRHLARGGDAAALPLTAATLLAAQAAALLAHRRIERPLTQHIRRFRTFV